MGKSDAAREMIWPQTCSDPGTEPLCTIPLQAARILSTADLIGAIPVMREAIAPPSPGPLSGDAPSDDGGSGGKVAAAGEVDWELGDMVTCGASRRDGVPRCQLCRASCPT